VGIACKTQQTEITEAGDKPQLQIYQQQVIKRGGGMQQQMANKSTGGVGFYKPF
jgi:hypothetical protein